MTTEQILAEAMGLAVKERARLAHELLLSLEELDQQVETAWRDEIRKRSREVKGGTVELADWESVQAEVLQALGSVR